MSSIILEIQKNVIDEKISVIQLLRKALVVSTKLKIKEFIDWTSKELNGYDDYKNLPDYRIVSGKVMVHNPYQGWQPVLFSTKEESEIMSKRNVSGPISEIEDLGKSLGTDSVISYPLPDEMTKRIMKSTTGLVPYFIANESQFKGIIETVKNIILNWAIKLETDGIVGDELIFSESDKEKVASTIYNIKNFTGIIGDVSGSNLQIGDYNSVHSSLKKLGISQEERNELEEIMDEYSVVDKEEKKTLFNRGMDWLKKNGPILGALAENIRKWF